MYTATVAAPPTRPGNAHGRAGDVDVHHRRRRRLRSIWPPNAVPAVPASDDTGAVEVGVKFRVDVAGRVTGIRFYKGPGNAGPTSATCGAPTATLLGDRDVRRRDGDGLAAGQLRRRRCPSPPGTTYVVVVPRPQRAGTPPTAATSPRRVDNGPLHALANGAVGGNGVYRYGPAAASRPHATSAGNYWVDVIFEEGA